MLMGQCYSFHSSKHTIDDSKTDTITPLVSVSNSGSLIPPFYFDMKKTKCATHNETGTHKSSKDTPLLGDSRLGLSMRSDKCVRAPLVKFHPAGEITCSPIRNSSPNNVSRSSPRISATPKYSSKIKAINSNVASKNIVNRCDNDKSTTKTDTVGNSKNALQDVSNSQSRTVTDCVKRVKSPSQLPQPICKTYQDGLVKRRQSSIEEEDIAVAPHLLRNICQDVTACKTLLFRMKRMLQDDQEPITPLQNECFVFPINDDALLRENELLHEEVAQLRQLLLEKDELIKKLSRA